MLRAGSERPQRVRLLEDGQHGGDVTGGGWVDVREEAGAVHRGPL